MRPGWRARCVTCVSILNRLRRKCRLSGFSIDRLLRFLMLLGNGIEITVKTRRPRSRNQALPACGLTSGNFDAGAEACRSLS